MNTSPLPTIEAHRLPDAARHLELEPPRDAQPEPALPGPGLGSHPASDELIAAVSQPISSVMEQTLWTVDDENTIEKVEEILAEQGLTSAPVVGSNGAVVGMIGSQELVQFHAEGKNAKACMPGKSAASSCSKSVRPIRSKRLPS
jgi:Mg/Co/Ni transporter MgtE